LPKSKSEAKNSSSRFNKSALAMIAQSKERDNNTKRGTLLLVLELKKNRLESARQSDSIVLTLAHV
jgi:hypothetical protein